MWTVVVVALAAALAPSAGFEDPDALPPGALRRFGSERLRGDMLVPLDVERALVCRDDVWRVVRGDGLEKKLALPAPASLGSKSPDEPWRCPAVDVGADGSVGVVLPVYDDAHRNSAHGALVRIKGDTVTASLRLPTSHCRARGGGAACDVGDDRVFFDGKGAVVTRGPRGDVVDELLFDGGRVVVELGGLAATDAQRHPSWRSEGRPDHVVIKGDLVLRVDRGDVGVRALDGKTGAVRWQHPSAVGAAVAASGVTVVVARRDVDDGSVYDVVAVDALGAARGKPVRLQGPVTDGPRWALSPDGAALTDGDSLWRVKDGALVWRLRRDEHGRWAASPKGTRVVHVSDDVVDVYAGDGKGGARSFAARSLDDDGFGADWSDAAFFDERLLLLRQAGELRVVDVESGKMKCRAESTLYGGVDGAFGRGVVVVESEDDEAGNDDSPFSSVFVVDTRCRKKKLARGIVGGVRVEGERAHVLLLPEGDVDDESVRKGRVDTLAPSGKRLASARIDPAGFVFPGFRVPSALQHRDDVDVDSAVSLANGHVLVADNAGGALLRVVAGVVGPPLPVDDGDDDVIVVGDRVLVPHGSSALLYPLPAPLPQK